MTFGFRSASPLLLACLVSLAACDLGTVGSECSSIIRWIPVEVESPTDADLYAADGRFVVGEGGTILRESAHRTWTSISSPTGADLYGVSTGNTGPQPGDDDYVYQGPKVVVVGAAGTVLYSEDAGDTWDVVSPPTSADLRAVTHSPEAWIAVGDGVALSSADGLDWSAAEVPAGARLTDVEVSGDQVWAVGEAGVLLVSDDHGARWRAVPSPTTADLFAITTVDDGSTIVVGAGGVALSAEANSEDVSRLEPEGTRDLLGVEGSLAVGTDGTIRVLERGDETAIIAVMAGAPALRAVSGDPTERVAVGDGGTIIEFDLQGYANCGPTFGP